MAKAQQRNGGEIMRNNGVMAKRNEESEKLGMAA
jgi:hypothetical protein